jgi:hypothetical protein
MNFKKGGKLRRIPSLSGFGFRRQQVRPTNSLSSRQQRFFRRNRFQFSGELRRNILRRPLLQLANSLQSRMNPAFFSQSNRFQQNSTFLQYKEFELIELKGSYSQMKSRLQSSLWIYQNPAAVPGAIKVRRARQLHLRSRKSSQIIKLWLNRVSEMLLYTLFVQTLNTNLRKGSFEFFKVLESTIPLILMKLGLSAFDKLYLNFQNNTPSASRHFLQYNRIYCNGQKVSKVWSLLIPGDYLNIQKKNSLFSIL